MHANQRRNGRVAEGAPLLRNYQARGTLFERLLTPFRRIKVALVDWNNPVTVIASPNMSLMTHTYDTLICTLTTNIKAMPQGREHDELDEVRDLIEGFKEAYIASQK